MNPVSLFGSYIAERANSTEIDNSRFMKLDELALHPLVNLKHLVGGVKINDASTIEYLTTEIPQPITAMLSARFLHIFKSEVISIPTYGVFNNHPGKLPHFSGMHCDFYSLITDPPQQYLTNSFHQVDTGVDTGELIEEMSVKVNPSSEESLFKYRLRLHWGGMDMFMRHVDRLIADEEGGKARPESESSDDNDVALISTSDSSSDGTPVMSEDEGVTSAKCVVPLFMPLGDRKYWSWPLEEDYERFYEMGYKQFDDNDVSLVKGLFEGRVKEGEEDITLTCLGVAANGGFKRKGVVVTPPCQGSYFCLQSQEPVAMH